MLPHPGGGGETYVDVLSTLPGYRAQRVFLARGPSPLRAATLLAPRVIRGYANASRADLVHVHGEVAGALSLLMLGRLPSVVTLHGLNFLRRARGRSYELAKRNLRLLIARSGRVICNSDAELQDVASLVSPQKRSRLVVVRNGVSLPAPPTAGELTAIRTELGIRADAVVGLYVGGLDDVKDPLLAARATRSAARQGARFVLLVAGDGPLRAAVQAEGGEDVRMLGFRRDVARLNAIADVFVLPSRREGLSYALLAAMAAGVAPVVSDTPGNVEAVGDAGVIVPAGDAAALANTLTRLVADPEARRRFGAEARARVESEFREDVMLERTRAVYDSVIDEHRQRRTS